MTGIRYVGAKPRKEDNVAGTRLTWSKGEVIEVADPAVASKLLSFPKIWQEASQPYTEANPIVAGGGEWDEVSELKSQLGQANARIQQLTNVLQQVSQRAEKSDSEVSRLTRENETLLKDLDAAETELEQLKAGKPAPDARDSQSTGDAEAKSENDSTGESKVELSIADIRDALTAKGIEYSKHANRGTLLKLLKGE